MDQIGHVQRTNMKKQVCACCTSTRLTCCSIFVLLLSLAFLSVGFFIPHVIDDKLHSGITDFLALTPEAKANGDQGYATWADWTDSRAPEVYYSVYVLNITNPNVTDILNGGKPQVTEIGPYVYREYKIKLNTEFSTDDEGHATVKYQDYMYYIFDRERTPSHLNPYTDRIHTINFVFQALKAIVDLDIPSAELSQLVDYVLHEFGKNVDIQPSDITSILMELLFGSEWGYTDETRLLSWVHVNDLLTGPLPVNITIPNFPTLTINFPFPGLLQNTTHDKISSILYDTIYTGDGPDPALLRSYAQWQEMEYLAIPLDSLNKTDALWGTPHANRIHGTDGTQFPRNLKKGEPVVAFVTNLFRAATLQNYNSQVNTFKGIDLLHFTIDNNMFANVTTYPPNAAFNIYGVSGVLNISKASEGLPVILSKPHFLDVGFPVNQLVTGLTANRSAHDTFLDVEPITGACMHAAKRIQINVHLQAFDATFTADASGIFPGIKNETWFPHINNQTLMPIVWIEEAGSLSDSQADDFKSQVYFAQTARYYIKWVGYIAGVVWAILSIFIFLMAKSRNSIETLKSLHTDDSIENYEPLMNPTGY